jgi:hypothetical protein
MSLAVAGMLVAPRNLRPLAAALGAAFTLAVSFSVIALGWHFPSDVAGGFLLAMTWTLLLVAGYQALAKRRPERAWNGSTARAVRQAIDRAAAVGLTAMVAAGALAVLALGLVVAVARPGDAIDFAGRHTAFTVVAAALTAAAVALLAALAAALTRRG